MAEFTQYSIKIEFFIAVERISGKRVTNSAMAEYFVRILENKPCKMIELLPTT